MTKQKTQSCVVMPLAPASFHVLQWLCHYEELDVYELIDEAFETAEQGEFYALSEGGVFDCVRPRLAELLEEYLDEKLRQPTTFGHRRA